ncbi:MAG: FAD-dependent oxidoreductase [Candidatus Caldarchaeum sp.]
MIRFDPFRELEELQERLARAFVPPAQQGPRVYAPPVDVMEDGEGLVADGVIIATPSPIASLIVKELDVGLSSALSKIEYVPTAVLNLAYRLKDAALPLESSGIIRSASCAKTFTACSFSSLRFAGRAPGDYLLMRCFIGSPLDPECFYKDDDYVIKSTCEEVARLLGISSKPYLSILRRNEYATPRYKVGHLSLVDDILTRVACYPGLSLAGNAYRGTSVPDCIHSGERAAEEVVGVLTKRRRGLQST